MGTAECGARARACPALALVDKGPSEFPAKAKKNPKQIRAWGSTVLPQSRLLVGRRRGVGGREDAAPPSLVTRR